MNTIINPKDVNMLLIPIFIAKMVDNGLCVPSRVVAMSKGISGL